MVEEYSLMLDEGDGDWSDHHKLYMDWVKTQPATTKTKLALMLNEVHSVPGADATSEISEVANAMERAAAVECSGRQGGRARARARIHPQGRPSSAAEEERPGREVGGAQGQRRREGGGA